MGRLAKHVDWCLGAMFGSQFILYMVAIHVFHLEASVGLWLSSFGPAMLLALAWFVMLALLDGTFYLMDKYVAPLMVSGLTKLTIKLNRWHGAKK